ncbi:uncharacterized protein FIBRA_05681 [Fibroporia radiculosa]|uniref:Uncharacterized protein n=1 Tax=Fibroporia radiculosa TaxID=599839 RepID=J4IAV0_9APHY|nr:uncharacterized protein FIBRA_05681 [Fibroporia radiculosa]CCM03546.1 predicted protein [Fibroporia radiculosa]
MAASLIVSCPVHVSFGNTSSSQSVADTLYAQGGIMGGITARTASTTSSSSRILFSKLPPYSSVR